MPEVAAADIEVVLVVAVRSPGVDQLVAGLERESIRVRVGSVDVLRDVPRAPLYVFRLEAALATALCKQIVAWASATSPATGVIGVIERGTGADREEVLAAGFDDVVSDVPSARELAARVRAVHRRVHAGAGRHSTRLRYGPFTLDVVQHMLWTNAQSITLTSIELSVMRELIKARGRPLSRADLLETAWGAGVDHDTTERAVDNVILRLRRKLPRPEVLETIRGVGFRLAIG